MIKFGMEIEFMNKKDGSLFDPVIYHLPEKWLHTREYYVGMQELISNPLKFDKQNVYKTIKEGFNTIKRTSYENKCSSTLYSYIMVKYNGIISNGVHIHLSFTKKEGYLYRLSYEKLYKITKLYENLFGFDFRNLFSHHIWGYYRQSNYEFKKKNRFQPVIISPRKARKPKTVEIRLLSLQDLLQMNKVYIFLRKTIHILKSNDDFNEKRKFKEYFINEFINPFTDIEDEISQYGIDGIHHILKEYNEKYFKKFVFIKGKLRRLK